MKKLLPVLLLFAVWMHLLSFSALAEYRPTGVKEACYMKIMAFCDESKRFTPGQNWSRKDAGADNHAIYVRHYVPEEEALFANFFRVRQVDFDGYTIDVYGGKWCAPGLNVPIQCDEIAMGNYYSVTARGNTAHYTHDGVNRIELRVNMYVNMKTTPVKSSAKLRLKNEHGDK